MKSYTRMYIQDDASERFMLVMSEHDETPCIQNYGEPDGDLKCHCEAVFVIDTPEKFAKLWDFITSMDKEEEE